jgi:hypothetical protein
MYSMYERSANNQQRRKTMRTIKSKEDLVQWAREVNPDYQDYYMHSDLKAIDKWFIETNGDRKLILCSVFNTMSYDEVERLLLVWAKNKAQAIIDEEAESLNADYIAKCKALHDREIAILDRERTVADLERRITVLESETRRWSDMDKTSRDTIINFRTHIENLQNDNQDLLEEVEKMQAFKATLRGILTADQIS